MQKNKKIQYEKPKLIDLAAEDIFGFCQDGYTGDGSPFTCGTGADDHWCGNGTITTSCYTHGLTAGSCMYNGMTPG